MTRLHWRFKSGGLALIVGLSLLTTPPVQTAKSFAAWTTPINLGGDVNSAFDEFLPELSKNELLPNGSFGPALVIPELNSPDNDFRPTIRPDGLELIFDSSRPGPPDVPGIGLRDLWVSTRASPSAPWSTPEHLGSVVNTAFNDMLAALSSDGTTLVLTSDRPEGSGGLDLYITTRSRP